MRNSRSLQRSVLSYFLLAIAMPALALSILLGSVEPAQAKKIMTPTRFRIFPNDMPANPMFTPAENLSYFGGPVIAQPRVVTVFWGPQVNAVVQKDIGGFYAAIVNSTHMDWLSQYSTVGVRAIDGREGTNQTIGRGSYAGEFMITPQNPSKNLQDAEIQAELEAQVAANVLPKPDSNTLFMIHFPPGISISIEGMQSCQSFCAYHEGFKSAALGDVYYGVMPDFGSGACSFGCGAGSVFDTTTAVSSHEFVEAVTDPFPTPGDKPAFPQAWNTSRGEEIADVCPSSALLKTATRTYKISKEWDNSTRSCKGGTFTSP